MTDLYRVWHTRPRAITETLLDPDVAALPLQGEEKVLVAQVPLADLQKTLIYVGGDERTIEVQPLGDSPAVCGMCQQSLATVDDLCAYCAEYVRSHEQPEVA